MREVPATLTGREAAVAELIADGLTDKEVAARLGVGVRTAQNHAQRIRSKLGLRSRSQVAHWVAQRREPSDLIGRRSELRLLMRLTRRSAGTDPRFALVSGPPGIGKTALIRQVVKNMRSAGTPVLVARCAEEHRLHVLWPLLEVVHDGTQRSALPGTSSGAAQVRHRVFASIAEHFRELTSGRPHVLVLEDLHWSDSETLDLVPYLMRRVPGLILIATYRDPPPYSAPIAAMRDRAIDGAIEIALGPLSPGHVAELITVTLGSTARPRADLRSFVTARSGGHPLLVQQLVRRLVAQGAIEEADGVWRPTVLPDEIAATGPVADEIRAGMRRLSRRERRILVAAAVAGAGPDIDLIARVAGAAHIAVQDAMRAGIGAGLLERSAGGYAFRHEVIRDALIADMSVAERRDAHLRTAIALETRAGDPASSVAADAIARHFDAGGDAERAVRYYLRAVEGGGHGGELADLIPTTRGERVAHHLERALQLLAKEDPRRTEALRVLAWTQEDAGRRRSLLEESLALAERLGDTRAAALSTLMIGAALAHDASEPSGIPMMRRGLELLAASGSAMELAEAHHQFARWSMLSGDPRAIEETEHALALARAAARPDLIANGLNTLGTALVGQGRIEGIHAIREGIAIAQASSAGFAALRGLTNLWLCLLASGAPDAELASIERQLTDATDRSGMTERQFDLMLLWRFLDDQWDDVLEIIDEMAFPPFAHHPSVRLFRSYIDAARRGSPPAADAARIADDQSRRSLTSQSIALAPELLHLAGDHVGALDAARRTARVLEGRVTREFLNTSSVAVLASAVTLRDDAAIEEWIALCSRTHPLEARTAPGRRAYALGETMLRRGRVQEALGAFDQAARAFAVRGATPLARTLPRLRRAELLARADPDAAAFELHVATDIWERVEATWYVDQLRAWGARHGLRIPAVPAGTRHTRALTPREVTIGQLVAEGLTNREIGLRLGRSARTAEEQIRRLREKLGVRSRAGIAEWVGAQSTSASV